MKIVNAVSFKEQIDLKPKVQALFLSITATRPPVVPFLFSPSLSSP